jgi:aminoglycoside phosphotransferase (APT) family kinase protein
VTATETSPVADAVAPIIRAHLAATHPAAATAEVRPRDVAQNGYSNVTDVVDAVWSENGHDMSKGFVVRSQRPGTELFYDTPLFLQSEMMRRMGVVSSVPVPQIVDVCEDASVLGRPFFIMEAVEGRVPKNGTPSYHASGWVADLSADQRSTLARNAVQALVDIHAVRWQDEFAFLHRPDRGRPGLDEFLTYQEQWYEWVALGRSVPAIERGLRWLRDHQPADPPVCISWGDSRPGNMIFRDDLAVAAVIDWEQAALGCAEMDVAWWLMFEYLFTVDQGAERAEGIPDREQLVALYESLGGRRLDDLQYYDVVAWVRIAICCMRMFAPAADGDAVTALQKPFLDWLDANVPDVL